MGTSGRVKCFMKRRNAKFRRYCPVAQSVERAAVNRNVVGSSPTGAAREFVSYGLLLDEQKVESHTRF